ncbi:MAG TPA: YhjD/YihY/BrkB family envelope integrity protein [Candidatus Acidoferrum sp.]|jgi:membrane protein|nr:YhjD/YihY/BrkB family envelope integrity protein [Candidatus Acidoferrum sp.]
MADKTSRTQQMLAAARDLLKERGLNPGDRESKWHRFIHFWLLVWRSFVRNRCPVRASALAYATLLALIPMLAVVMSITSGLLKQQGEAGIEKFIVKLVASVTPPATLSTNVMGGVSDPDDEGAAPGSTNAVANSPSASVDHQATASTEPANSAGVAPSEDDKTIAARKAVARRINEFVQNTRSSALGVTGSLVLIFVAISMLSRIETTFNDIWGVARGRSWFMRIVLYWGVLSLAPILLVVAVGLATGPHLEATRRFLASLPFIGSFVINFGLQLLPVLMLCLSFGAFYMLMPNTRVHWRAALVGGLVGGILFHLNNLVSVLYVSRVVSNSKIYGSLGLVPVFMIGLYFSWLLLLFGAQVAYAYQNRAAYLEERQVENINQRGREFIALRLMTLIGQRYVEGLPPASVAEMGEQLAVPTRLVRHIMQTLSGARLVVETAGAESAYLPARPMERITCHDMLQAMRASQGQELSTRDEPGRAEVYGEFQRIQEAERLAASSVSMLALVQRAQPQIEAREARALE